MPSHSLMELGDGYETMEWLRNRRDGAPSGRAIKHGRHTRVDEVPITGECPAGLQYPPDSDSHDRQLTTDLRGGQSWITNPGFYSFRPAIRLGVKWQPASFANSRGRNSQLLAQRYNLRTRTRWLPKL